MPADSFIPGELFDVTIFKSLLNNPALVWANTYRIVAEADGDAGDLEGAIRNLMEFERNLHITNVQFRYGRASTFVPDTTPYDADEFVSVVFGAASVGTRAGATDSLSKEIVWSVRKLMPTGRFGKLAYRFCLRESDVVASAGTLQFANPTDISTEFNDALDDYAALTGSNVVLGSENPAPQIEQFSLCLVANANIRRVRRLGSGLPSFNQFGRRHFNRQSP